MPLSFVRLLHYALFVLALAVGLLAAALYNQLPFAMMMIPWDLDRMACAFLAAIAAASAFPILWVAMSREDAALTGGAINFVVTFFGFTAFAFAVYASNPRLPVLIFGICCLLALLVSLALLVYGMRQTFHDARPLPLIVRLAFGLFALILIAAGIALVLKVPNVFPWQLTPQQSVLYGWIFLGAATYFLYGLARPVWGNAQGQLLGFLAYDIVLIMPFVYLVLGKEPFLVPNLLLYIFVLLISGALALYFLFFNRETLIAFKP